MALTAVLVAQISKRWAIGSCLLNDTPFDRGDPVRFVTSRFAQHAKRDSSIRHTAGCLASLGYCTDHRTAIVS
jgi:hypothetical protein